MDPERRRDSSARAARLRTRASWLSNVCSTAIRGAAERSSGSLGPRKRAPGGRGTEWSSADLPEPSSPIMPITAPSGAAALMAGNARGINRRLARYDDGFMDIRDVLARMRTDWNRRAAEDAYYYVAFGRREQDDEE